MRRFRRSHGSSLDGAAESAARAGALFNRTTLAAVAKISRRTTSLLANPSHTDAGRRGATQNRRGGGAGSADQALDLGARTGQFQWRRVRNARIQVQQS